MQYKFSLPDNKTFALEDLIGFVYADASNNPRVDALRIIADGH